MLIPDWISRPSLSYHDDASLHFSRGPAWCLTARIGRTETVYALWIKHWHPEEQFRFVKLTADADTVELMTPEDFNHRRATLAEHESVPCSWHRVDPNLVRASIQDFNDVEWDCADCWRDSLLKADTTLTGLDIPPVVQSATDAGVLAVLHAYWDALCVLVRPAITL